MKNIKEFLRNASESYYNGNPIISDAEFDELSKIAQYDEVGYSSRDNRFPHLYPMFSLQKVFVGEGKDPFNDYRGATVVTPKLDGAAVSILYVNGTLQRALTRGDGRRGIDITHNLQTLVPQALPFEVPVLQITGEVVAPKSIKNARNYAAGALNLKDTKEFATRELHFIAYGCQPHQTEFWSEDLALLGKSFNTVMQSDWNEFPHDGSVFRIDDYDDFDNLGYTSHHPRGAYALKEIQDGVETTLVDVLWNVGKSGVVAPVAILEPVEVDGATVSRATLHNMAYIESLNLEIGCRVELIRSGEIIPRIVRRVE